MNTSVSALRKRAGVRVKILGTPVVMNGQPVWQVSARVLGVGWIVENLERAGSVAVDVTIALRTEGAEVVLDVWRGTAPVGAWYWTAQGLGPRTTGRRRLTGSERRAIGVIMARLSHGD